MGLTVALTSGHTISGHLVPNEDLHPLARRAVVDAVATQSAGTGRRGEEEGRAAAERWSRETAPPLWKALAERTGPEHLTFARAYIGTSLGVSERWLPTVRVDASTIVAWWLIDEPASDHPPTQ